MPRNTLNARHLAVLVYANKRSLGQPWTADLEMTEECRDLGLLEAGLITGMKAGQPDSLAYTLTPAGRRALAVMGLA